jgi:hypothetical protein
MSKTTDKLQFEDTYPSSVTLRKQKLKATFKTLIGIRFVAKFSNMMDTIIPLD